MNCDQREKESISLKADNKKLALAQTLLASDFDRLRPKYAVPSGAKEYAQCQKDLRDAQIRSLQKDETILGLEISISSLRDLILTQGLELPSENSVSAPAPAPATGTMSSPLSRNGNLWNYHVPCSTPCCVRTSLWSREYRSYEDCKREREVRQKTWNADGKTAAETWAKSLKLRTYMCNLTLEEAQTLLNTLKQANRQKFPTGSTIRPL
jgi:hypothetical protein